MLKMILLYKKKNKTSGRVMNRVQNTVGGGEYKHGESEKGELMQPFKRLKMNRGWIYEVVLTSFSRKTPHAAPFGMRILDFRHVGLSIYRGARSLENILGRGEFVVNMTEAADLIHDALLARDRLDYGPARMVNAPVLRNAPVHMEMRLTGVKSGAQLVMLEAEVVHLEINKPCIPVNRAEHLLLESLITATRIPYLPEGRGVEMLKENYRVVRKVAPGSAYAEKMEALLAQHG